MDKRNYKLYLYVVSFLMVLAVSLLLITGVNAVDRSRQIVTGAEKSTYETATEELTEPTVMSGWINGDGKWSYIQSDGTAYTDGILTVNDKQYCFDENGTMLTGLQKYNNLLYYFCETGDTPQNGLGALTVTPGWLRIGKNDYYVNDDGSLSIGWKNILDNCYYFDKNGAMKTGWTAIGDELYFFKITGKSGTKGSLLTGWQKIDKKLFYFSPKGQIGVKGRMATGLTKIGNNKFFFKTTGKIGNRGAIETGWKKIGNYKYFLTVSGKAGEKGKMAKNQIAGNKKLGYAYVDNSGKKIKTKAITLATKFVVSHTSPNQSRAEKLKTCFDYIKKYYPYQRRYELPKTDTISKDFAEYLLKYKCGNCFCYGAAFACVAKVLGYESRFNEGVITTTLGGPDTHGWAEVKVKNKWYLCDISMHMVINTNLYMKLPNEYPHKYKYYHCYSVEFSGNNLVWKEV